ncbi:MAG TPA: RecQ family ATP-dependent DNA helicase, partial [Syntrophales bacterium]|nr:RecQ family ATP-dependent DNA helicase [Syntrophales bacterium]
MSVQISQAKSILKRIFGYDTFWPLQEEVIVHLLDKQDALVVLPTGGGKSLCYQIPALLFEGLTIVVSPLLSLMKDQVDQLKECGVPAVFLNSTLTAEQYRSHVERLRKSAVKLLYMAPEALLAPRTMALLSSLRVDCFAVDEAHCISEWGHDFRPEYRQLMEVRSAFPAAVCVSMTATATPRVREDIRKSLQITAVNEFIGSFNRPNLFLEVAPKTSALEQTLEFIDQYPNESGIIYCFSRRQTDDLYATLARRGYSVRPYHAGLSDRERTQNQELFTRDDIRIIVATIAFGMGINKSNVRFVVHYDFPKSIDTYYQEIGRAGRDGLPAHCLLLFGYGDIQKINYFIQQKDEQEQRVANILLSNLLGFAETDLCRRVPLLNYFGETHAIDNCGMCDNCRIERKDLTDITIPVQMFLSCVKRTGERFGAGHIVDVLRGSQS